MVLLKPLPATAILVAAVGKVQGGMAGTSTEKKEQSSQTVTEVPAPPSTAQYDPQVESHTSMSTRQQDEADGSVEKQKKSSTTEERASTADPLRPDTVYSERHSQRQTTKATPSPELRDRVPPSSFPSLFGAPIPRSPSPASQA